MKDADGDAEIFLSNELRSDDKVRSDQMPTAFGRFAPLFDAAAAAEENTFSPDVVTAADLRFRM
jgi:hypothetical protein